MSQSLWVRGCFREAVSSIEVRVVLALDANERLSSESTLTYRKDQSAPRFFHLRDRTVLAVDYPPDIAQLLRLTLDKIGCPLSNRCDDEFPHGKSLEKQLIRHCANCLAELVQVRNGAGVMLAGDIRRHGVRLSVLERIDDDLRVRAGIQRDELDERVVSKHQTDNLCRLRLVQATSLNLDVLIRPCVSKAQEFVEQVLLDSGWNH